MSEQRDVNRKEQFLQPKKRRRLTILAVLFLVAGLVVGGILLFETIGKSGNPDSQVAAPRRYVGRVENMKSILPVTENGRILLKLSDVDQSNIVSFTASTKQGAAVPMMAYITSTGRLFVGSSVCLCGSETYALAGETLFCTDCRTTFAIEDRQYISGAITVGERPPIAVKFTIENGMIMIEQREIEKLHASESNVVGK